MNKFPTLFCASFISIFTYTNSLAITIYVDQASGDNTNDGLTPETAIATITQGSTLIGVGDTIDIGPGIYSTTTGETYPVTFTDNILIQGAGPNQTVLDGELSSRLLNISQSETANVTIDGLAIINGADSLGAGIRVGAINHLTLSNCQVNNNEGSQGGGVFITGTTNISITSCHFDNNNASIGSGMQIQINGDIDVVVDFIKSTFSNHTGTAIQFQANGSGMHTLNINQSRFLSNSGTSVNFQTNNGSNFGQVTNSLFADNLGTTFDTRDADVNFVNTTFVNNSRALDANDLTDVNNSIFWNNNISILGSGARISFTIIDESDIDNHIDAGNNLDVDPLLDQNYRLTKNSPAIDMGSDIAVDLLTLTQDIDLEERKFDFLMLNRPEGIVDIGAHELGDLIYKNGFE